MVVCYYGADTFRSHEMVVRTIAQFREKRDPHGYNTFVVCAADGPDTLREALVSTPFMGEKKMVVMKDVVASGDRTLQDEFHARLADYDARGDVVIVVHEAGDGYKSALWRALCALPYAQRFDELKGETLFAWVRERFGAHDMTIEREACALLSKRYASDMWALNHACAQLVAYVQADGRAIVSADDCRLFLPRELDENTFHVLDAIHGGEGGRALQVLDDQWKAGKRVVEVIGLMLWQWRVLLQVKALLEREPHFKGRDVARALGIHPFVADKSCRLVRDVSFDAVRRRYAELLAIDEMEKTGGAVHAALARFVFDA